MQAVILAGGLGTRLGPLTRDVPKPMVPVAGRPFLEHQLELLRGQGFTDIVLLTGYRADQIESHFGDGRAWGVSIRYSRETDPLGTGGALSAAALLLADPFLLIYGDSLLPMEYAPVLEHLLGSPAVGVVVLYDNREETTVQNNVAVDAVGYLVRYAKGEGPDPGLRYVDAGVLAFRRKLLDRLPSERSYSLERTLFPDLIARRELLGLVTPQRFYDIGTPERLALLERRLKP
jgi:NDP-sugar pyrophosphorylase family protein